MATDLSTLRLFARFDEGAGPAIVMLHGINSDGGDWRTVIDTIGPGYRFVAFDLLGFGESPKPLDIEYNADEHALVIENTLLDKGIDEPFLLVGYSLGGDIALRYASTYPHRLRRLFLLDAPFYLPASALNLGGTGLKLLYERVSKYLWDALGTSKKKDGFVYRLASGAISKPLEEAFHSDDIPTHWEIMSKNLENTVNAATWVDDLPKLTMPVVHAIGVRDAIVPVSQAPALKRLKPDMEIRKIAGLAADHMVLWNMPERVAEEIMRDEVRQLNVVWRKGDGAPMLLLHGLRNRASEWIPAAEILARDYDVALIDLLGFSDSPAPLSLHYTLADHVAAVMGTVTALWGADRPVIFVGEGLGATVALGCAAEVPDRNARVVAFSPGIIEPGTQLDDLATDERSARIIALRDMVQRLSEAALKSGAPAEQIEARLTPLVRSLENTMLAQDADDLLARVPAPARFVIPSEDTLTPSAFIARVWEQREGFELMFLDGERGLPYLDPAAAVQGITPEDAEGLELARKAKPRAPGTTKDFIQRTTGSLESTLLRTGLLNLGAAAAILVLHPLPDMVLSYGFAIWVTFASASAIFGAITMKRKTAGARFTFATTALPTLVGGLAGLAIASLLFAEPELGRQIFGIAIAVYATARGGADLWTARHIEETARPRWLLYLSGVIGIVTALAIVFGPNHGVGLVRLSLAFYLVLTGATMIGYVVSARKAAEERAKLLMER